jgi:hypothetical protein
VGGSDHRLADPESLEMMLEACRTGELETRDDEAEHMFEKDWPGLS